jgi:hypothetical protein
LFLIAALGVFHSISVIKKRQVVVPALLVVALVWGVAANWVENDQSGNTSAMDGVHNYYKSTEKDPLIVCANWDYASPWLYSHFYLRERPDVMFIDPELVRRSWYFDWIKHTDSKFFEFIKPEVNAFLPNCRLFESKKPYDVNKIEQTYQGILQKLLKYPDRKMYYDQSANLKNVGNEKIAISGELFRYVRDGESFSPPTEQLAPPQFGKSDRYLDWREKWHQDLFNNMAKAQSGGTHK